MAKTEVIKTGCALCGMGCGILVTLEDGKAVKAEGDPEHPLSKGDLCKIGLASLEYLYHPDRLKHPLKRVGERGEGRWQQISWDEAFGLAAEALNKVKREHGPEAVLMAHGSAKGLMDTYLVRLANAFGTPNVACADFICHIPRMLAAEFTFGFFPGAEYGHPPACIISWGANKSESRFFLHQNFVRAKEKGAKLIVIDPLETEAAKIADLWLQVRPGSDLALALAMINVVINEGLYDKDFVDKWTIGFDKLKAHVQDYTPEKVSEITWVPADLIVKAARMYANNRPGRIEGSNGLDQNVDSFQTCRAISILLAIVGNLGVPGGEIETGASGFLYDNKPAATEVLGRWSYQIELRDNISREERRNKVGADLTLLPDYRYVLPTAVLKSILEGEPYRIHAAYVQATNPLSCWPNVQKTFQALNKLDFLAVTDMFMTPTAALADIVFPVATHLEFDSVFLSPGPVQAQRKVAQIGECRSDYEVINGLAKKLGLGEYFWENTDDLWDAVLEPAGLTFEELKKINYFISPNKSHKQYRKYQQHGFKTPSGKVELYSSQLEQLGSDPLPRYYEPPETPYSDPELAQEYPLQCTTRKLSTYRHSGGRQIPSLRAYNPDPRVFINPETAAKLGIEDDDWVYIETKRGRIKQRAKLSTGVDPRVVVADHAWWFPEKGEAKLFGWADSNYNVLTNDEPPLNREVGSINIRGLACKVYKE